MEQRNYKSDFNFILRLRDCRGDEIGWPDYDWSASFYIPQKTTVYTASCIGGKCINCFNDNGHIRIVMENHGLMPGVLNVWFTAMLPNGIYPDEDERVVVPVPLDIELIRGAAPCPDSFEVELMLPYVNIKWEDLTPEQIEELKQPAVDAAKEAGRFVNKAEEAERTRVANETTREEQETARAGAEAERAEAEMLRVSAENGRKEAETLRVLAEEKREDAEQKRVTEFAGFKEAIDAKPDFADLSNVYGEPTSEESDDEFEARTGFTREDIKKDLFDDMFKAAAGSYGTVDHAHVEDGVKKPYYLNELWLTYEEAVPILVYWQRSAFMENQYWGAQIRTNIPQRVRDSCNIKSGFYASTVEVVNISRLNPVRGDVTQLFRDCRELRKVLSPLYYTKTDTLFVIHCYNLETIFLHISANLDLRDCPKIDLESISYLIRNRQGTNALTVTVHPNVYAKLIDETNTEWHQLLLDAAEKQIQFATA